MPRSYSADLRERVVAFVGAGHSRRAAARHFDVSDSFAVKLLQRFDRVGSTAPSTPGRRPGEGKLGPFQDFLIRKVLDKPDITMPELGAQLEQAHGVHADPASLSRFLCRHGFTYKKSPDGLGIRTPRRGGRAESLEKQTPAADAP